MLSTERQTDKQTNKQTSQRYQKHNLLCQGGKKKEKVTTRSTQKAQTSLAEADHYSHIAQCKNFEL